MKVRGLFIAVVTLVACNKAAVKDSGQATVAYAGAGMESGSGMEKSADAMGTARPEAVVMENEAVDIPNNISGALLTCWVKPTALVAKGMDLGCYFSRDKRNRIPLIEVADSVRFEFENANGAVKVEQLPSDESFDVTYRVVGETSSASAFGAVNLRVIAVLGYIGRADSRLSALGRELVLDPWLSDPDSQDGAGECLDDGCVLLQLKTGVSFMRHTTGVMNFAEASAACDQLDYTGHADWRLPNESEFMFGQRVGLADQLALKDRLTAGFPGVPTFWSRVPAGDQRWVLRLDGAISSTSDAAQLGVLCIR